MRPLDLDIVVTRGTLAESRHRVHAVAVAVDGTLLASAGDPWLVTWWRSCAKLFQIMPLLETGRFDDLGWGAPELAIACASHGGEPEHLAVVGRMLASLGLEEGDLACGPHEPLSVRGARIARDAGDRLTRLHNNCSGKHAAMLATARGLGAPTAGYERAEHPVQQACTTAVGVWTGVPQARLAYGIDGCGVVVYALPLVHMAQAYARLGAAAVKGSDLPARILSAVREHPMLLGGTERFDTVLLEETHGEILAKVGAEGVHTVSISSRGWGLALKVEDGALRAQHAAVLVALQQLGVLPAELPSRLADFVRRPIRNTRGEVVGEVAPAAALDADRATFRHWTQ